MVIAQMLTTGLPLATRSFLHGASVLDSAIDAFFHAFARRQLIPDQALAFGLLAGGAAVAAHFPMFVALGKTCYSCHLTSSLMFCSFARLASPCPSFHQHGLLDSALSQMLLSTTLQRRASA